MITKEKLKEAVNTLVEFKKQATDVYKTLREHNAQNFLNGNEHFDSFRVDINNDGVLSEFININWSYDAETDTIIDSTNGEWYFTKEADLFFMDKKEQLTWIMNKLEEKKKEEEKKLEIIRKAEQEEQDRLKKLEEAKSTDEYQQYLKLKDKFSSLERRN